VKIGIKGYFGYANFGDELFLEVWKQIFKNHDVRAIQFLEDIDNLDVVIIGGGDLVIPTMFTNAYWQEAFLKKPTYVYGVGVSLNAGQNEEAMVQYRQFFDKCKAVYVRDQKSFDFFKENNFKVDGIVHDLAFSYESPDIKIQKSIERIGMSIRPNRKLDFGDIAEVACLSTVKGYETLLIPLQPTPDRIWN
jgi:polysaccharide pyruvyl transferase WcaK-like protein